VILSSIFKHKIKNQNGAWYEAVGCGQWRWYALPALAGPELATVHQAVRAFS
jgi:hypothetical protein